MICNRTAFWSSTNILAKRAEARSRELIDCERIFDRLRLLRDLIPLRYLDRPELW